MKKVTGIGGIFFKCQDPKKIKDWYRQHLGIDAGDHGFIFQWNDQPEGAPDGSTVWSPFKQQTDYFNPSVKEFMINYRVADLEALVTQLTADGVPLLDTVESYPYGKFVHLLDPEGNKIELWEPVDS